MAEQGDQSGCGSFNNPYGFNGNKTVILKHYFGQTLRISPDNEDEIDLKGDDDEYATWNIEIDGQIDGMHIVKFKSIKSGKYLTICGEGEAINVTGDGGEMSKFKVYKQDNDNLYKFESVNFDSKYPAVQSDDDDDQKVAIQNEGDKFTEFTLWSNEEDGAYVPPKDDNDNKEDVDEAAIEEAQKEEEDKKQAEEEEEARKKAEEEEERKRKEEEEERKRKEEEEEAERIEAERIKAEQEEAERKREEEEEARKKAEEEEAERLKAEEEARKKKEEEERIKKEEEERIKKEEEQRKREEEERIKKEEEEQRKREEEEERKKKEEEERIKKEEEERIKKEEEERIKKEEEEQRKREEEEERKKEEEEEQRKREEEEEAKKKAEEEEAAAAAEAERLKMEEEEERKRKEEEEKKKREEEEERKRKEEEEAAAKRKAEAEAAVAAAEEQRKRKEEEEERKKKEEEEERKRKEEEERKKKEEEEEEERKRKEEEEAAAAEEEERKRKEEEEAKAAAAKEEEEEEEEECNVNIEVGMKFEMGGLYYSVHNVDKTVICIQLEDIKNNDFPSELVLQRKQMEHVVILSEDDYNIKVNEYKASQDNKEEKEEKEENVNIEIGIKFEMGSLYYSVKSIDEFVKCEQLNDIKNNQFPMEIMLEKNQMNHVKILSDDDYKMALNEYNNKSLEEKEEKQDKKEDVLLRGLESFTLEYIFDDDPETVIIRHQQGQTLMVESNDETKLNYKGDTGEYAQWIVEFDGGDKYQRITLKNKKTNKYLRIINDGKDIDVDGDNKDDDNIYFKAITNDNDKQKHCIKLESCSFNGKYIAIESDQGIIIGDIDNKYRNLSFWKQLNIEKGLQFKMGDIYYEVQDIGDHVKCKQSGDNKEFPEIVYLERNQLYHVEIIQSGDKKKTDKINKERPLSAKAKIAMFEKKEDDEPKKKKQATSAPKKLRKSALNAKFGGLNINPNALKPGGGKAKITNVNKEHGAIDQKPKVEQATITKGKRKRRKKKKIITDDDESKDDHIVAPQLFYDEKAAEKRKKEKEKEKKQKVAAVKGGGKKSDNNNAGNTKGGKGGNTSNSGGGQNAEQQGEGGGCCVIL